MERSKIEPMTSEDLIVEYGAYLTDEEIEILRDGE